MTNKLTINKEEKKNPIEDTSHYKLVRALTSLIYIN